MSVIYVLLAISISVAVVFFAAFVLSVRKGQYDDTYTPSVRMLFEDGVVGEANGTDQIKGKNQTENSTNQ
ncbi:cbb3-type cytochrome oxidase assembly protein CcoS [Flagellimonas sp.]|uniref:cbb3-type cytochrome oxidase assembly protein CcoS n=1 Tax=Flagellimonas sp. TaxID=2058762 RepID=UPI003AB4BE9C